jgi:UDP-N-acetylglucosamine 2-epimerase (non-hydrolysing)
MKTIMHVVGARPNYMKIAPLMEALNGAPGIRQVLVNTGQHYDEAMSKGFLRELGLPTPDRDLNVGSASHAVQTAKVMIGFETVCLEEKPDLVVVAGDVNSTMAATLVSAKLLIPVAHLEAGLRSFDPKMPEEINRVVTDRLAQLLLTPSADADQNLLAEGVPASRIHLVGNIMIDTLLRHRPLATLDRVAGRVSVKAGEYAVLTLHRPSNVDDPQTFARIVSALNTIAANARANSIDGIDDAARPGDDRADGLHRLPESDLQRPACAHGFRRAAGRIDGARHPVCDPARKH